MSYYKYISNFNKRNNLKKFDSTLPTDRAKGVIYLMISFVFLSLFFTCGEDEIKMTPKIKTHIDTTYRNELKILVRKAELLDEAVMEKLIEKGHVDFLD